MKQYDVEQRHVSKYMDELQKCPRVHFPWSDPLITVKPVTRPTDDAKSWIFEIQY